MPPRKRRRARPAADATMAAPTGGVHLPDLELDLHGMRAADAEAAVLRHLSACHAGHLHVARFNHGHGTGVLRQVVTGILDASPLVARRYVDVNPGVTVAELRYGDAHRSYNRRSNNLIVPRAERRK